MRSPPLLISVLAAMLRSDVHSVIGSKLAKILADAKIDPLAISIKALIRRLGTHREIPISDE